MNVRRERKKNEVVELPHAMVIDGTAVDLVLCRSARRSFALQIDHRGARVAVPLRTSLQEVERFVHSHGRWLLDRLKARAEAVRAPVLEVADGVQLPLFGCPLRLRLREGGRTQWRVALDGGEELVLPLGGDPSRALLRALQARALPWYRGRVAEYCHRLGLKQPPVRLSNAVTRWGSCSSRSGIRLHWRLIHLQPGLIDYVVAHEVAHLIEMNHSPRFWAVVEGVYPNWRAARSALRAAAPTLPVIGARGVPERGAAAG